MVPQQFFYQLAVWGLLWLFVMLYYAWPSRGMAGEPRPAMAIEPRRKRSRAPQPFAGLTHTIASCVSKPSGLILYPVAIEVGERTLAMAQRVVHQVVEVLAPGCVPLLLTDGFKDYVKALLGHFGHWVPLQRRQATGPLPKSRWMPLPQLLYAQVVKTVRRGAWLRCNTAWYLARLKLSITCWFRLAGTSIRPSWSASISTSASMWRRSDDESARCGRAKTSCDTSWHCSRRTTTFVCLTRAYASPCWCPNRPTVRGRRRSGDPVCQPWRWD